MSDKRSGTNENLPDLLFCLVCLAGPALIDNTVFIIFNNFGSHYPSRLKNFSLPTDQPFSS